MDTMTIIWLCALFAFALVEAVTLQLICIWFAVSDLIVLIVSLFGVPVWAQITIFCLCTAALLYFTRPLVRRLTSGPRARTNADRVLDMAAVVVAEINNDQARGQVKVNGQIWTARSLSGNVLPLGEKVVVRAIEGVKVIVEEFPEIKTEIKEDAKWNS